MEGDHTQEPRVARCDGTSRKDVPYGKVAGRSSTSRLVVHKDRIKFPDSRMNGSSKEKYHF